MSTRHKPFIAAAFTLTIMAVTAHAETEQERRTRILSETKMNIVMDLPGPASEFKGDGDPTTLEIVFLTRKSEIRLARAPGGS